MIRVALQGIFPEMFMYGGAELQLRETQEALRMNGVIANRLRHDSREVDFDILHLFQDSGAHYPAIEFAPQGLPIVLTSICPGSPRWGVYRPLWSVADLVAKLCRTRSSAGLFRQVVDRASIILVNNERQKTFYRLNYSVESRKIAIVPNGVRDEFFNIRNEAGKRGDSVCFLGSIIQRKRPLELAVALSQAGIRGVFAGAPIVGEEVYFQEFQRVIDSSNGLLHYLGRIGHASSAHFDVLRSSRVFCLPSESEVQSLAALEAMAAGCVVVLGDRSYAKENPFSGALRVEPTSIESIKRGVLKALDANPVPMGSEFSWRGVGKQIREHYERLL